MLISRFRHCSKTFCLCMYDVALWKYYFVTAFNKFRAAYNKCIKKLFGYARCDSMSGIFLELRLPTADTIDVLCLQDIARCHLIRSFSGLLTLLYCNFIFMVFIVP